LKTILRLLLNDLKRDWKRPWAMLLLAMMPLALSVLIASVFGGRGGSGPMPTVHVAILDQDKDLLTGMLRSMPSQGDAAKNLRLHFVESREEGWRLVEKDKVSALVVLPTNMTANLLNGQTNSIELYENPAQQVLPKVVRQGVSLLALGLSATAETLGGPLRDVRDMIRSNGFPASLAVGGVASNSVEKLGHLRSYVFPPLLKFETVPAADFEPFFTNAPAAVPAGSNKVVRASSPARSVLYRPSRYE
jgi:ABC-2 family transporter protein